MIEKILYTTLSSALDVPVYFEEPENPPVSFLVVSRARGGRTNTLDNASVAIQSFGGTLYQAALLNEKLKAVMLDGAVAGHKDIGRVSLNSDYNWTDPTTKRYRYQAIYDITYYGGIE